MKELQDTILKKTVNEIYPLNLAVVIINAVFSAAIVLILLVILEYELDVLLVSIVIIVSIGWVGLRDLYRVKKNTKQLYKQHDYIMEKKPYATLHVPIFGKVGARHQLKNAALFFIEDRLFMEAYKKDSKNKEITESRTVKQGKDFIIHEYQENDKHQFVTYKATLMTTDYEFNVVNIPEVINMIEKSKGVKEEE